MKDYRALMLADLVPFPASDANKFSRGVLTCVAGCERYPGAALLCARAAQRSGAGYTRLVSDGPTLKLALFAAPSLVGIERASWVPTDEGISSPERPKAVVLGPGFDANDEALRALALDAIRALRLPIVVDGGALSFVADSEGKTLLEERAAGGASSIITPHAGEALRLLVALGHGEAEAKKALDEDSCSCAREIARAFGAVCVLKGPVTWISDGDGAVLMDKGTPALAKAGSGDVLAGIIGALLAQGLSADDAAVLGAFVHARAGREAARSYGDIGVVPEDLIEALPRAFDYIADTKNAPIGGFC